MTTNETAAEDVRNALQLLLALEPARIHRNAGFREVPEADFRVVVRRLETAVAKLEGRAQ